MGKWYSSPYKDGTWACLVEYDSYEDAVEDGVQQYMDALDNKSTDLFDDDYPNAPSGIFYVAEAKEFIPNIDVYGIIEDAEQQAHDAYCSEYDDYLSGVKKKDIEELESMLQPVFADWIHEHQGTTYIFDKTYEIDAKEFLDKYPREPIELNSNGVNNQIKYHILSDDAMRNIGFTDHNPKTWYFCRNIGDDISFNVSIPKNGVGDIRIDVLDEDFLQPYDYQAILDRDSDFPFALLVEQKVEEYMKHLQNEGVLSGHIRGEYI